ncbi:MAG: hypothetical protein AAF458_13975 [Pseudomonadota bacterium]
MDYPFDIGSSEAGATARTISTSSATAQRWFDRGLAWTYAYNQEEAVACYRRALAADAECAMAWWGIAYAAGPFYNRPWDRYTEAEIAKELPVCYDAACQATRHAASASPVEQALITAICLRYQSPDCRDWTTLADWHAEFAIAMRAVQRAFPDDLDVLALYAEAAITCTPRALWNLQTGVMNACAHTAEVVPLLERALADLERADRIHAGIAHIWIHTIEMSPNPELGLRAADDLRGLWPDAGHLQHMPAHIDVLCGDYIQALQQSRLAVAADERYLAFAGDRNFYTTARCHDLHLYMYTAMFLGQFQPALYAADRIAAIATDELLDASAPYMHALLDAYSAMRIHVLVRFGRWWDLAKLPRITDVERRPIANAMREYGRGVAFAALGQIEAAEQTRQHFHDAMGNIPSNMILLSNRATEVLGVGEAMLDGELLYRKGRMKAAFSSLRLAVRRDDNLNYTEPWAWMHPPRHALGALLNEQGRTSEAQAVFHADLGMDDTVPRCCQHPGNVWALTGLANTIEHRAGAAIDGAFVQQLRVAKARADRNILRACFCAKSTDV